MEKLLIVGELASDTDLARVCAREGYEVGVTESRSDALEQVEHGEVSIVLLCQCFGDADGLELVRTIRATDPRCEVILVSCNDDQVELPTQQYSREFAVEVLNAGALDYLRQPIALRSLRSAFSYARRSRGFVAAE